MAPKACFVLLVIVRVVGSAVGRRDDVNPDRGRD
jgi:hypothetical protein